MLFNSLTFVVFFAVVYALYLLLQRGPYLRAQNTMLLAASYVFYGAWDWRFLGLLVLATAIDFFSGMGIYRATDRRRKKAFLLVSLTANLVVLGFFKYFNFFQESFARVLTAVGFQPDFVTMHVILPIGISFYTFQSISYAVEVYRGQVVPTRNFIDFSLFVAFFPHMVAGPIQRASTLLPQVLRPRRIDVDQINAGIFLILWGYFKKVVVADNLALIANQVFNNHRQYEGIDLALGTLAFAFQIYGDFSGYSDIARGLAKLMGFELVVNFRLPYFAVSPSDFWSRWHISLSTWLRDNLYVPLGGNRYGDVMTYRNLALTMLLGGLWHGAAWNFVLWGAFHGAILIVYRLLATTDPVGRLRHAFRSTMPQVQLGFPTEALPVSTLAMAEGPEIGCLSLPSIAGDGQRGMSGESHGLGVSAGLVERGGPPAGNAADRPRTSLLRLARPNAVLVGQMAFMFVLTNSGWILFRSRSVDQAFYFLSHMGLSGSSQSLVFGYELLFFSAPLIAMQCWQYKTDDLLAPLRLPLVGRVVLYSGLVLLISAFAVRESTEFIYFQF